MPPWLQIGASVLPFLFGGRQKPVEVDVPEEPWWRSTAAFAAGSSLLTNIANAREASVNRRFQERMSSTSFQRAARDMKAAGINPQVAGFRGGSSTPSGAQARFEDSGAAGLNAALAVRRLRAETELIEAQAHKTNVEAGRVSALQPGELDLQQIERAIRGATRDQLLDMMPVVLAQAKAEVGRTISGARAANASAALDEMAKNRAFNEAQFEQMVGQLGPWGRAFMNLLRGFREIGTVR